MENSCARIGAPEDRHLLPAWDTRGGMPGSRVEKVRILVQQGANLYRLAKVVLKNKSADFYVLPYSRAGRFYFGGSTYPEEAVQHEFNYREQDESDQPPHLSFHASGQVHVRGGGGALAGPLAIPSFDTHLRGHVATVRADSVEALCPHCEQPRLNGRDRDMLVLLSDNAASCKLVLSLARPGDKVAKNAAQILRGSPDSEMPAILVMEVREDFAIGGVDSTLGSTLIGGWDPQGGTGPLQFLFVRTE